MDKRFTKSATHRIKWCTGKDSNLRTSLGGTDLQSVGFNHSPTCANSSGDAACYALPGRPRFKSPESTPAKPADQTQHTSHFNFAEQGNQGSRKTPRRSLHAGKVQNGVRWKNLLRRYRVRRRCRKF